MFGQMPVWLHAAPTKKEKNGCKLYHLLFAHYLGSDHVNHLANKMEARLAILTYHGEQKNWDWSQYIDAHIEQQNIAKNLMEQGYSGLDKHSKVRHLLTGIQHNAVQPVACQVLAMREDDKIFTMCLALFVDFICHLKQIPTNVRCVVELGSSGHCSGKSHDAGGEGWQQTREAQVKAASQTNLRWTKSLGFMPTGTAQQRSTRSSIGI